MYVAALGWKIRPPCSLYLLFLSIIKKNLLLLWGRRVHCCVSKKLFLFLLFPYLGYQVACDGRGRGVNLVRMLLSIYPSNCSTLILMFNKLLLPSKKNPTNGNYQKFPNIKVTKAKKKKKQP